MITDVLLTALEGLGVLFLGLIPAASPRMAASLDSIPAQVQSILDWILKLDPLIPFDYVETSITIFLAFLGFAAPVFVIRKVYSMFSGGGL